MVTMTEPQRVTLRYPAPTHTMFSDAAARSMIGQRPRFDVLGRDIDAIVVDARVIDDGAAIELTIETSDGAVFPIY